MTFPPCRRKVLTVVFLLAALVTVVLPSVALAAQAPAGQTVQAPPAARAEARGGDGFDDWGLLGLLGLAGLAGLLRRGRPRSVTVADRPDRH